MKNSTTKIVYMVGKDIIPEMLVPRTLTDCEYQPLKVNTVSHLAYLLA